MDLREIEARLPPGFRFYPTDEELVCHYLYNKIRNERLSVGTMVDVDLNNCEPWQLPDAAKLGANEWYFFSYRERKYATGLRTNRATVSGYWKATGKDRPILSSLTGVVVGMRKTLVFYLHRAPNGVKTGWIMHEFRLEIPIFPSEDWVLCRVFHRSKGDRITKQNSEDEFDNIGNTTAVAAASQSVTASTNLNQAMQGSFQQFKPSSQTEPRQESCSPNVLHNIALLNPNFLEFPLDVDISKNGEAYELFYNINSEE